MPTTKDNVMRFLIIGVLWVVLFSANAADLRKVDVTITSPVNGREVADLESELKLKAIREALPRLPVLLTGKETLSNDRFEQNIEAIYFAFADVEVNALAMDKKANEARMDATVIFDLDKSKVAIGVVADKRSSEKEVAALYEKIAALIAKGDATVATMDQVKAEMAAITTFIAKEKGTVDVVSVAEEKEKQRNLEAEKLADQFLRLRLEFIASFRHEYVDVNKYGPDRYTANFIARFDKRRWQAISDFVKKHHENRLMLGNIPEYLGSRVFKVCGSFPKNGALASSSYIYFDMGHSLGGPEPQRRVEFTDPSSGIATFVVNFKSNDQFNEINQNLFFGGCL